MQTTRRRRSTANLSNDGYDPKNKSNANKQILVFVVGVAVGLVALFLLFRLFSTSTPSTVSDSEAYANMEERANDADERRPFGFRNKQGGNGMPNINLFKNPLERNFPLRDKQKMYDEMRKKRVDDENMDGPRGRNLDDMRAKLGRFGALGNLRGSHFSERGEGPIFNDLNSEAGDTKLSPDQVQELKQKMRPGMDDAKARDFPFKDRSGGFFKAPRFRKGAMADV